MEYKHVYDLLTSGCNFWTSVMVEQAEFRKVTKNFYFYYNTHTKCSGDTEYIARYLSIII